MDSFVFIGRVFYDIFFKFVLILYVVRFIIGFFFRLIIIKYYEFIYVFCKKKIKLIFF